MSVLVPPAAGRPTDEGWLAAERPPPPEPPGGAEVRDPAERLGPPMPTDRLRGWLVTLSLAVIAGLVRFWNLAHPTDKGTPIFDEKHYVPQAWQLLRNGGYEDNPGFRLVVHPPLGKQLIAIGEWLFGYNGLGWRFTAAVAGTVCVILIVRIARRLTRSTLLGALAGVLLIADGVSHVGSRVGMLDIFLTVFVVAGFGALLVDRDQMRGRLAIAVREGWATASDYGPRLGFRWWRFAGVVLLGLGLGVKWSAGFFVIFFAALSVFWDVTARRAAGVRRPWRGTFVRDLGPAFLAFAAVPGLVYLGTWWAWYASETGVDRHLVGSTLPEGGTWGFIPDALRALIYNNNEVLTFHNNLSPSEKHPYESKPWAWPMGLKPMLYYLESNGVVPGCGRTDCMAGVKLIGTPAMWWLAFPMLGWAIWRAFGKLDWRYAAVLVGYGAGYLPWFTNLDRQMYYFYATPMAPFMVLGLVLILGEILGKAGDGVERRRTGLLVVALYVGLVIANFVWLWPILNGDSVTPWRWQAEVWLPSWN